MTLKRGLIGSLDLWKWIQLVRQGDQDAKATVVIELKSEANTETVAMWQLENARPQKWSGPTLGAKGGSDVAMEELVLVCENIVYS